MKFDYSGDVAFVELKKIIDSNLPVVLFGFGGSVFRMYDHLNSIGLDIEYIIDNSKNKHGQVWGDARVISFNELKEIYEDCCIIITVSQPQYVREIRNQIEKDGKYNKVYYFDMYYPFGEESEKIVRNAEKEINMVYELLADEESKICFENKINFILTKNRKYLEYVSDSVQYFPLDIFKISDQESFIDAGAFHGEDSIMLKGYSRNMKSVCIEPDEHNFKILKKNILNYSEFSTINAAVWSEDGYLRFAESGSMGSTLSKKGTKKVRTIAIDDLNLPKVTFVKMDVEGAEIDALKGAYQTILEKLPKLAICVYHTIEHHWEVPLFIHNLNKNYRIYMRQHEQTGIETVCYATI